MSCPPDFCRGGCCRDFLGTYFCDVESNCVGVPTLIIILVPALLIFGALLVIIIMFIRLKFRKKVDIYHQ